MFTGARRLTAIATLTYGVACDQTGEPRATLVPCPGWEGDYAGWFTGVIDGEPIDSQEAWVEIGVPPNHICTDTPGWKFDFAFDDFEGWGMVVKRRYCGLDPASFGIAQGRFGATDLADYHHYTGIWELTLNGDHISGLAVEVDSAAESLLKSNLQFWGTKDRPLCPPG